jgi:hypothetical protein
MVIKLFAEEQVAIGGLLGISTVVREALVSKSVLSSWDEVTVCQLLIHTASDKEGLSFGGTVLFRAVDTNVEVQGRLEQDKKVVVLELVPMLISLKSVAD